MAVSTLWALLLVVALCGCLGGNVDQMDIEDAINHIKSVSKPDIIPIPPEGPLTVYTSLYLTSLRDVDEEKNEVEIAGWLSMTYQNPNLGWAALIPDLEQVKVSASTVWIPDLEPFNSVDEPEDILFREAKVVVTKHGNVIYIPAVKIRFACDVQPLRTPEGGNCTLPVGSWTYNGWEVDLISTQDDIDVSGLYPNPEYAVVATKSERKTKTYPCCPEPYVTVEYTMSIKQKSQV